MGNIYLLWVEEDGEVKVKAQKVQHGNIQIKLRMYKI